MARQDRYEVRVDLGERHHGFPEATLIQLERVAHATDRKAPAEQSLSPARSKVCVRVGCALMP
jgi:hypothetical protein